MVVLTHQMQRTGTMAYVMMLRTERTQEWGLETWKSLGVEGFTHFLPVFDVDQKILTTHVVSVSYKDPELAQ